MIPFVFINDHHCFCRIENRLETGRRASRAASEEAGGYAEQVKGGTGQWLESLNSGVRWT